MKQAPRSVRPFVAWLRETHSSELMVQHCTGAALLAMKVCKKALLQLSPEEDLPEVLKQVEKSQSYSRGEQTHHRWGLVKLIQFLRWYNNIPAPR